MKKHLAFLLALCMLLSLCACGGTSAAPEEEHTPEAKQAAHAAASEGSSPKEAEDAFTLGSVNGNSYINEFFGVACEFDSSWTVADRATLNVMSGIVEAVVSEGKYRELLENSNVVYDLYAYHEGMFGVEPNDDSVNANISKLDDSLALIATEQDLVDNAADAVCVVLSQTGITVNSCDKINVVFAGAKHPALYLTCEYDDDAFFELITCIKRDDYCYCITASSAHCAAFGVGDHTIDILSMFTAA